MVQRDRQHHSSQLFYALDPRQQNPLYLKEAFNSQFPQYDWEQIAFTVVINLPELNDSPSTPAGYYGLTGFNHRGNAVIYPASIIKLFYLVAAHHWLEAQLMADSPELQRAIADMIIDSSNDATSLVIDTITNTTSGPALQPSEFKAWQRQRNQINDYFQSFHWPELLSINANQKTWGNGYYGREHFFVKPDRSGRNALTTDAVARLMTAIIFHQILNRDRCQQMMKLLQRPLTQIKAPGPGEENQITDFIGSTLPQDYQLWSKAGWTSQVRHDAAYIRSPQGASAIVVIFTEGEDLARDRQVIPFVAGEITNLIFQLPW
ncbi:MAG: serine hydrolase [Synechococcaceae cyanobacterium RL_1_2]|nr:serine hydrolase [Synechococcaceae cyanobacterium RL_1_2]